MLELIDAQGNKWQYKDGEYREQADGEWHGWKLGNKYDVEMFLHITGILPDVIEWKEVEQ